ncbi:non-functional NADPH-dependent codeinone reductase 2-like [Chenopodium quinoa]|uniref:NADP-dependent oxidoreductase domain-containing protein n=1 Tax=Chenopodium quinoa TaxID=63459 RepID=A0A803MBT3_CHEQI|nr:non-functional NADPH-dependent codeinone reductase 2-like [Chenopodium quinoa]
MPIPRIQLSHNGGSIPVLGFGTAPDPPVAAEITKTAVLTAIEAGYRHFDTACLYYTEQPLGEAIAQAIKQGLITSRDDLFITSKLWCSDGHRDRVVPALQATLRKLNLDYVDLYLIHWPVSSKPGVYEYPIKKEDFMAMDYKSVWEGMEECKKLGLAKSIGVSNFSRTKLAQILSFATIPPAVNQVEVNPSWQQKEMIEFCKAKGVLVTAYSPLGAFGTFYGSKNVMESDVLKEIANRRNKSVAQVCLRWGVEQGIAVVVKSFNKERMKQNLDIFDWELSAEDLEKIRKIPQYRVCRGLDYTSNFGPFVTIEELWDGEI